MHGRLSDFDKMKSAVVSCVNGIPLVEGGWTRRPGTAFCDETRYSHKQSRIVRFKYSTTQSYAIEFGDQYVRFKKNRVPVYDLALTITGVSNALPGVLTYSGTDPSNGDDVDISGVVGMTELNGRRFIVQNVNTGANTFELHELDNIGAPTPVDTNFFSTYVSDGVAQRVYTLATPYLEADLFQLKFARQADKLYIFHSDYPEATLNRFADASWTHTPVVFADGPYLPVNKTATTLAASVATPGAGRTITASSTTGINDGSGFLSSDVGRLIRLKGGASSVWGYAIITGYTSTTQVTVTIINSVGTTTAATTWRMGLLSDTTGYSDAGTFVGGRLIVGGCPYRESRWDVSYVDDYLNFAETEVDGTTTDAHAFSYTLTSEESQAIRWIRGIANGFAVGTFEGEWLARPSINEEAMTPTNRDAKQSSAYGSERVDVVKVGSAILAIQKHGRRIREITYSFADNRLNASDMTILSEHMSKTTKDPVFFPSGFIELAYQQDIFPILWAPRKDGVLAGATYNQDEKVMAWHRTQLGGYSATVTPPLGAIVESVCVIPAADGSYEEAWFIVRRYVNNRIVRYVEYLTKPWEKGDDAAIPQYLDSSLFYDGEPISQLTGMYHLRGETVSVVVDGASHPDVVVSPTGGIQLDTEASKVVVGYSYNSDLELFPFDAGSADGTAQGKIQRKHHVAVRLHQSLNLWTGPSFDKLRKVVFRTAMDGSNARTPLFTGLKLLDGWHGDYSTEDRLCVRFTGGLPGTVLSVIARQDTSDT